MNKGLTVLEMFLSNWKIVDWTKTDRKRKRKLTQATAAKFSVKGIDISSRYKKVKNTELRK